MRVTIEGVTFEVSVTIHRVGDDHAPRGATIEIHSPAGWSETTEWIETTNGFAFFGGPFPGERLRIVREVQHRLRPSLAEEFGGL